MRRNTTKKKEKQAKKLTLIREIVNSHLENATGGRMMTTGDCGPCGRANACQ
jgi:hypothetical protein